MTPRHSPRSSSQSVSNPSSSSPPPPPPSPSGGTSRRKICSAREHFLALTPQTSSCQPPTYWGSSSWSWRREGGTTSPTSLGRSYCRRRVSVSLWSEINTAPPRQVIFSNSVGQLVIHSNAFQSISINISSGSLQRFGGIWLLNSISSKSACKTKLYRFMIDLTKLLSSPAPFLQIKHI